MACQLEEEVNFTATELNEPVLNEISIRLRNGSDHGVPKSESESESAAGFQNGAFRDHFRRGLEAKDRGVTPPALRLGSQCDQISGRLRQPHRHDGFAEPAAGANLVKGGIEKL